MLKGTVINTNTVKFCLTFTSFRSHEVREIVLADVRVKRVKSIGLSNLGIENEGIEGDGSSAKGREKRSEESDLL